MNSRIRIQRKVAKAAKLLKQASAELGQAAGEALVIQENKTFVQLRNLKELTEAVYGITLSGPYQ